MNIFDTITLEAFVRAVSQLEALSPKLQSDIHQVSVALAQHEPKAVDSIRDLVKEYAELKVPYEAAYQDLQQQYQSQERTKSLAIATNGSTASDIEYQLAQVLRAENLTAATRKFVRRLDAQLASPSQQTGFWERGSRIIALSAGGAFLGAAIAQVPGAVIGGLFAAIFMWWYSEPKRTSSRRHS